MYKFLSSRELSHLVLILFFCRFFVEKIPRFRLLLLSDVQQVRLVVVPLKTAEKSCKCNRLAAHDSRLLIEAHWLTIRLAHISVLFHVSYRNGSNERDIRPNLHCIGNENICEQKWNDCSNRTSMYCFSSFSAFFTFLTTARNFPLGDSQHHCLHKTDRT